MKTLTLKKYDDNKRRTLEIFSWDRSYEGETMRNPKNG